MIAHFKPLLKILSPAFYKAQIIEITAYNRRKFSEGSIEPFARAAAFVFVLGYTMEYTMVESTQPYHLKKNIIYHIFISFFELFFVFFFFFFRISHHAQASASQGSLEKPASLDKLVANYSDNRWCEIQNEILASHFFFNAITIFT
jgi:hypothetical protein